MPRETSLSETSSGCQLYVGKLQPSGWTEDIFRNQAEQLGKIVRLKYLGEYGFVTYETPEIAQHALFHFRNKGVLANYALKDFPVDKNDATKIKKFQYTHNPIPQTEPSLDTIAVRKAVQDGLRDAPQETLSSHKFPRTSDIASPECLHCGRYTPLLCRECFVPFCNRECWEYGRSKHKTTCQVLRCSTPKKDENKPCFVCRTNTTGCCKNCNTPFCSQTCLIDGVEMHFLVCGNLRRNESNGTSSPVIPPVQPPPLAVVNSPSTETVQRKQTPQNTYYETKNKENSTSRGRPSTSGLVQSPPLSSNGSDVFYPPAVDRKKEENEIVRQPISAPPANTSSSDEKVANGFGHEITRVLMVVYQESTVWVLFEPLTVSREIEAFLDSMEDWKSISRPEIGMRCVAEFEDQWYRAKIVSIKPELRVFFIDYGNEEICTMHKIKEMPEAIANFPPQAEQIKLFDTEMNNQQLTNRKFIAKCAQSEEADLPVVSLLCEIDNLYDDAETLFPSGSEVIVSGNILGGIIGVVEIKRISQIEAYTKRLTDVCAQMPVPTEMPSCGSIVAALCEPEKEFRRARIVKFVVDGALVDFCDYGQRRFAHRDWIRAVPANEENEPFGCLPIIPVLAKKFGQAELSAFWDNLIRSKTALTLTYEENDLFNTKSKLLIGGKCCSLMPLPNETASVQSDNIEDRFPDGCAVSISHVVNHQTVAITRCDPEIVENYDALENNLIELFRKAEVRSSLPNRGDIVVAYNQRQNIHGRVKVLDHEANNRAKVTLIDHGGTVCCDLKDLRPLLTSMKTNPPAAAITVQLKNVPDSASSFFYDLKSLKEGHHKLILKYNGNIEDGVHLLSKCGSLIGPAKKTETLTEPVPEESSDPPQMSLQNKGDQMSLVVTYVDVTDLLESGRIWVADITNRDVAFVTGDMTEQLQEDIRKSDQGAYRPKESCLCAVFDEGNWVRAACREAKDPTKVRLFLVDWGKEKLYNTDVIRPLPSYLRDYPPIAMPCIVNGYERFDRKHLPAVLGVIKRSARISGTVHEVDDNIVLTIPEVEKIFS